MRKDEKYLFSPKVGKVSKVRKKLQVIYQMINSIHFHFRTLPCFGLSNFSNYLYPMNYFEFYGIAESFSPDDALLKKKFYQLSKEYHPDFYANEDEAKQQEILELSTLNNKAYQTLSDPYKRLEYILKTHELLLEGAKPQLPTDFLMEMMDINERLMEVDDADHLGHITGEVLAVEDDISAKLTKATSDYSHLDDTAKESRLNEIADCYYRQKYLLRIKESLNTFATRF